MHSRILDAIRKQVEVMTGEDEADASLVARFVASNDAAAFATIVRRHGTMVWGVCRNLLPQDGDAEDAFQATFLALVRSAKNVRNTATLGPWLHGVAVRVATKLKRTAARRKIREGIVARPEATSPVADSQWDALLAAVHEEVNRLPEAERTAFVLCCLEGVRQPVAAAQLGWKPGTLTGRLSKAKRRLLDRLSQRGLAPALALGAIGASTTTGSAIAPATLIETTLAFANEMGAVPASILTLSQGVSGMMISKVKLLAAAVVLAGGMAMSLGTGVFSTADAQTAPRTPTAATPPLLPPPAPLPTNPTRVMPPQAEPAPMLMNPLLPQPEPGFVVPVPPPVAEPEQIWEYRFQNYETLPNAQKFIVDLGQKGWELCVLETQSKSIIFKRPAKPAAGPTRLIKLPMPDSSPTLRVDYPPTYESRDPLVRDQLIPVAPQLPMAQFPRKATEEMPPPASPPRKFTLYTIMMKSLNGPTCVNVSKVLKELIAIDEFTGEVKAVIADEGSDSILVLASPAGKKLVEAQIKQLEAAAAKQQNRLPLPSRAN